MPRRELIKKVKRIVVKIGSSTINEEGKISSRKIGAIADDIKKLTDKGYKIVIVSSGAVSAGAGALGCKRDSVSIPEKQALAAVGQTILMNEWRKAFSEKGIEVGQILLTEDDVKNKNRYFNVRHTFNSLLEMGIIPIVNENDSVVIKELKFGDNDILSAYVANIIEADLLILLSDVDGFYWNLSDPEPADEIYEITEKVRSSAGGAGSVHGTGGMSSKIRAAEVVIKSGEMMIIASGSVEGVLGKILNGSRTGTLFYGKNSSLNSRKRWIAFNTKVQGKIVVDDGAVKALCSQKKSLLPPGIIKVEGKFDSGDAVEILNKDKKAIAKGITNYNYIELDNIKGKRSDEIKDILNGTYFEEVINRDDLIIY